MKANSLMLHNVNWISQEPKEKENIEAKIRYRQVSAPATLIPLSKDSWRLEFKEPQRAITSGQFAAIYKDKELIGGGVIV